VHALSVIFGAAWEGDWSGNPPPTDPSFFAGSSDLARNYAQECGESESFRRGLAYLLAHPEIDLEGDFEDDRYWWRNSEIRSVLTNAYRRLWPNDPTPTIENTSDVELSP
jgi:hypothetical protein